jgi:hypothetical protein
MAMAILVDTLSYFFILTMLKKAYSFTEVFFTIVKMTFADYFNYIRQYGLTKRVRH